VIKKCFDDCVGKVSAASLDQDTFESTLCKVLTTNEEHLVCCAKSLKRGLDLCFMVAACNVPSIQAHYVAHQHVCKKHKSVEEK
jgi:hypothetical protein